MSNYNTFDNQIKDIIITIEPDNNEIYYNNMKEVKLIHETPNINIVKKTYKPSKFTFCCCMPRKD